MSPERTQAYGRVMQTLNQLGPSKLLDGEQERIRYAADSLVFSSDLRQDTGARKALDDVESLCRALVESGRWQETTATRLADDLFQCGPTEAAALRAA
jgi:hypothetical protein